MPTWIKLKTKERPFYDPRTGKVLSSIEGRRNRPGIDPFEGGGKDYPEEALRLKRLSWQERGTDWMLLVEDGEPIPAKATVLDEAQALHELKQTIGLPEGTTLGADKKPIIPLKEKNNETITR